MKITILDTYTLFREMLALLAEDKRLEYFGSKIAGPFAEAFARINMPASPEAIGCLPVAGHDGEIAKMLEKLKGADAWNKAYETVESSARRFRQAGVAIPEKLLLGIFPGNPAFLANAGGYAGLGSVPGYIQIVIAPNSYNLPRLQAVIAHEYHHNVLFTNATWNFMDVTVAKYVALEGLAESFGASLYGEEYIGPWVTNVKDEDLKKSRAIIEKALTVRGFMEVRKYVYGDYLAGFEGSAPVGIPAFAGYAVGYHAVQAFLKKTGMSVEQATLLDGETIMQESGYFG